MTGVYNTYTREVHSVFIFLITLCFSILIKIELKKYNSVKGKLKAYDTKVRLVDNKYLYFGLCVNNLSNQVIECVVDIDKSSFVINGVTIAKEQIEVRQNNLYPFATHGIWVEIMDMSTLNTKPTINIACRMYLKYSEYLQHSDYLLTCQFSGVFALNSINNQEELKLIKVIVPASPIK